MPENVKNKPKKGNAVHFTPPISTAERAHLLSCGKPKHRRRYVTRAIPKGGIPTVDCPECLSSAEFQQALGEEMAEVAAATSGAPAWYVCSECPFFECFELSEWRAHRSLNRGHTLAFFSRVPQELQGLEECRKAQPKPPERLGECSTCGRPVEEGSCLSCKLEPEACACTVLKGFVPPDLARDGWRRGNGGPLLALERPDRSKIMASTWGELLTRARMVPRPEAVLAQLASAADFPIRLRLVVLGLAAEVRTRPDVHLKASALVALDLTGNAEPQVTLWRAQTVEGTELELSKTLAELGLEDGAQVFLTPDSGPASAAAPSPPGEEPAAVARPLPWMELRIFLPHEGAKVGLGLTRFTTEEPPPNLETLKAVLPREVRCDRCGLSLPFADVQIEPGERHEGCSQVNGTWRGAFRFMVDPLRRLYLSDGLKRLRIVHVRGEAVADVAIDAELLLEGLENLAADARRRGLTDTAGVYDRMAAAVRPHAQLLEKISAHLGTVGQGLPSPLSEYLSGHVEEGTARLEGEPSLSGISELSAAEQLGVPPEELARIGGQVKGAGGPAGSLWQVQEDALRLADTARRAARALVGHRVSAGAYVPERLNIFAAQVREAARLAGLARRLVLLEPGQPIPPEVLASLKGNEEPAAAGASESPRCTRCGGECTPAVDELPDQPPRTCAGCALPEADCTCPPADLHRLRTDLALQVDASIIQGNRLVHALRKAQAAAARAEAGGPASRSLEVVKARADRIAFTLTRVAEGLEKGSEAEEVRPATLAAALREVEEAGTELARASVTAANLVQWGNPLYNWKDLRMVLFQQSGRAELEAYAAAVLGKVVSVEPGGVVPPELSEAEARIIDATRNESAPHGFEFPPESGKDLGGTLKRSRRAAAELASLARVGAALASQDERAKRWKLPELLAGLARRAEGHATAFGSLAQFVDLPKREEMPSAAERSVREEFGTEDPFLNPCGHIAEEGGGCVGYPECSRQPPSPEELQRRAELVEQAGALSKSQEPPSDPEPLRIALEAEGCTLEGWNPGEGVWWAKWSSEGVGLWLSAQTAEELLAQARWLNARLLALKEGR